MAHPSDKEDVNNQLAEDDLGRLIRWGLQDSFSRAEPPDDVWPRIRACVQEKPASKRAATAPRRRVPSFAPLVQTVVVSTLLLAFGLGVDRNLTAPWREQAARSTPTAPRVVISEELPNDMLSGYLLARMEQRPPAPQRPGGARP